MSNSIFPFVVEIIYTVLVDDQYFLMGQTYNVESIVRKEMDPECGVPAMYCGLQNHYVVVLNDRDYAIPAPAAAIVADMKDPAKMSRLKYWIDKSQGEDVKDYVKLAMQMHGVYIGAKVGADQADYRGRDVLRSLLGQTTNIKPGQVVKVIVPEPAPVESNINAERIAASLYLSIVSARFYRGESVVYLVAINKVPVNDVTVTITMSEDLVVLNHSELTFTPENYNIGQSVIVTIDPDADLSVDKIVQLTHTVAWEGEMVLPEIISLLLKQDK